MDHSKATAPVAPYQDPIAQDSIVQEKPVTPGSSAEVDTKNPEVIIGEKTPDYSSGDIKSGSIDSEALQAEDGAEEPKTGFSAFYAKYRIFFHLFIWLFFTAWWVAGIVLHREDPGWLIPTLLYIAISLRLITFHTPLAVWVFQAMNIVWDNTVVKIVELIPQKLRLPLGTAGSIAVILVGSFVTEESADNTRANRAVSLFGLVVILFFVWLSSTNRKAVQWQTIVVGMLTQFIIAVFVLRTQAGYDIFKFIGDRASDLLGFAAKGVSFLTNDSIANSHMFIAGVIPAIVFFVAISQILYFYNILQWFIGKFAVFFSWSMQCSGAESVVAAASPFIGQGESAMLIKPFVAHMTDAEIHQIMTSGFATIAGSVLAAYIFLGVNAQVVVSSCVMSIPASLAISKLRYPETEQTLTTHNFTIPKDTEDRPHNAIHAFANGAWLGLKIAGMIVATLLCILALVGLINGILTWWGHYYSIPTLTLQLILGYIFYPVAFLLGVSRENGDLLKVAELIGIKVVANEFVAYTSMTTEANYLAMSSRSKLIASYALCGFGNIGSLGTQIGVLSQIAPGRAGDVSRLAVSALICGILSTLTSAAVAGLLVTSYQTVA